MVRDASQETARPTLLLLALWHPLGLRAGRGQHGAKRRTGLADHRQVRHGGCLRILRQALVRQTLVAGEVRVVGLARETWGAAPVSHRGGAIRLRAATACGG
jgi:hypothetical protein